MKKVLIGLSILLMFVSTAWAMDWSRTSGQQTASALIYTGGGVFQGIIVSTDSANAVTLDIYDGLTATGTKLIPTVIVTSSAIDRVQVIKPPFPVRFVTGLYVNISSSGTAQYVTYFY